ncbi:MAG: HAMP domain-containing histidine kinase [Crocinitomicaceae bacterium]|jgi:two-component system phosphate regulon sensor histidine kinase PhoR|nr:HAMP domain-containing histidine kinase [Crocinitomicaceae bacterium]MCF8443463.1 HAMP domain-containing histidine kinase [Crocinitomicaceae bacterium]
MKQIRVNIVVILLAVSVLSLFIIQAFQVVQLYERKLIQFNNNLKTSLERIAIRHEKAEDIRRYMRLVNNDFSSQYKDILKQEFQNLVPKNETVSIADTIIYEGGKKHSYLIIKGKAVDSLSGVSTEQKVYARDVRELKDLFDKSNNPLPTNDSMKIAIQLDEQVLQQVFKKARFVNDMMVQAFRDNIYADQSKRIDIAFLDSVIRNELKGDDLPQKYSFAVGDNTKKVFRFPNKSETYDTTLNIKNSGKTVLFPSNIIDEDIYLYLSFPTKENFLLQEMQSSLIVTVILVVFIIISLVFMFKTILAQKRLSEMKSDFISNMTHEFKTPISTISLACEAMGDTDMLDKETNAAVAPYVNMINQENKRLSILVESILQSAVIEKGEIKYKDDTINLGEIIKDQVENARFRIKNMGGKITFSDSNELIEFVADKMHVSNIISNLLDNAIKYSRERPEITVSLESDNKHVYLSVTDTGIGIKKEHLPKLFDKLFRVPTGNIHNVKGFGLGLSYVKAICDHYKWDVTVKSTHGEGSTFVVVFKNKGRIQ